MSVQCQQRWVDIDTTLAALAAGESDRNSEVLQQGGYAVLMSVQRYQRRAGIGAELATLAVIESAITAMSRCAGQSLLHDNKASVCCH